MYVRSAKLFKQLDCRECVSFFFVTSFGFILSARLFLYILLRARHNPCHAKENFADCVVPEKRIKRERSRRERSRRERYPCARNPFISHPNLIGALRSIMRIQCLPMMRRLQLLVYAPLLALMIFYGNEFKMLHRHIRENTLAFF